MAASSETHMLSTGTGEEMAVRGTKRDPTITNSSISTVSTRNITSIATFSLTTTRFVS